MNLLWTSLRLLHFINFFHFLYLLIHCLPYQIRILHHHSVIPLDKYLLLGHIQQLINMVVMVENGLRTIVVLNKKSIVLIHSANGS